MTLVVFLLVNFVATANNDSLKTVIKNTPADSIYIQAALDLAWNYMYENQDSAVYFAGLALTKANNAELRFDEASAYNTMGVVYIVKAEYYQALAYLAKGLEIGNDLLASDTSSYQYKRRVMTIYTNMGNIYYFKGKYDEAINSYLKSLQLADDIGNVEGAGVTSSNLASAYMDLRNYEKALQYNYLALSFAKLTGDSFSLSQSYNNLGSVYFSIPNYDSAHHYFQKSAHINLADTNKYELIKNYVNLGDVMRELGRYDSALYFYNLSMNFSIELNSVEGQINCNYMIGQLYQKTQTYDKAALFFKNSLKLARETGSQRFIMMNSEKLSEVYREEKNYEKAYSYFVEGSKMRDSIFNAESDERIADVEARYQADKKEKAIQLLKKQSEIQAINNQTNRIIYFSVITILILLLVLIVISYRSFRYRQNAEKRKMQQEAERNIFTAIIETENSERKRFAEDLHDGLGVLLSTLRLYINEIDNKNTPKENTTLLQQCNVIIDEAILNARNISNNIMPASLKQNGLMMSVKSFAEKISRSGSLKIRVHAFNAPNSLNNTLDISLYRILTELINNTIKHAQATEVNISFAQKSSFFIVTYADNGIGFEYEKISQEKKGMGLNNIINRVQALDGIINVQSSPGNGFKLSIKIKTPLTDL